MKPMTIVPMAVARLRPYAGNARTHSKKQIRQIADSIKAFGFTNPVLIGDDDEIIAGHGRVAAAKLLGLDSVPTVRLSHLDAVQRRAYGLADNKLALNAGWDRAALARELQALTDTQYEMTGTGFSVAEIELVLGEARGGNSSGQSTGQSGSERGRVRGTHCACEPVERAPHPDPLPAKSGAREKKAPVTRRDDLWLLDRHRLLCGDACDLTALDRMLEGERVVFVAFDPAACDRIAQRFRRLAGHDATLAATGQSFTEVAERRGTSAVATAI
jgi:hypothetical protein